MNRAFCHFLLWLTLLAAFPVFVHGLPAGPCGVVSPALDLHNNVTAIGYDEFPAALVYHVDIPIGSTAPTAAPFVPTFIGYGSDAAPACLAYEVAVSSITTSPGTALIRTIQASGVYDDASLSPIQIESSTRGRSPKIEEFLAAEGTVPKIRGHTPSLRNPAQIDQIKADMLNGDNRFNSAEGIISGVVDSKGVIHLTEGQHRMNAALEIFEETGNPEFLNKLLDAARTGVNDRSYLIPGIPPAGSMPLPRR